MSRNHRWVTWFRGHRSRQAPPLLFTLMPKLRTINGKERDHIPTEEEEVEMDYDEDESEDEEENENDPHHAEAFDEEH